MGNAGEKVSEFAENAKDEASEFVHKLVGDAHAFAGVAELLTNPPSKPSAIQSEDLRQAAEAAYPGLDVEAINIGVIGGAGTGKLSLINALSQQPRSAAKKIVSEDEVKVATQFTDPKLGHVRFWYLPDEWAENDVPSPDYFFERCMYAFDVILILVGGNRIRPGDLELAKQAYITDPPTPVAFLRTKVDGLLIASVGRVSDLKGWDREKERIGNRQRSALRKQIDDVNLHESPVFLVSQAGILDVYGKESNDMRYVVDEYQFFKFLVQALQQRRYEGGEEDEGEKEVGGIDFGEGEVRGTPVGEDNGFGGHHMRKGSRGHELEGEGE